MHTRFMQIVIQELARQEHVSEETVLIEMQKALDAAWEKGDMKTRTSQNEMFPEGKPTLEQFIQKIAERIENDS